jgi:uncharacterized protein (TIGR02284 family)
MEASMATTTSTQTHPRRAVAILNRCIETCIDGERGYAAAAADVRAPALKGMLLSLSNQRASFVVSLQGASHGLGEFPENQGTAGGLAHRGFMGLRRAVEGPTDRAVLEECARGEREATARYREALRELAQEAIPTEILQMIESQFSSIRTALADIEGRLERH